jgi:hypothetical protein
MTLADRLNKIIAEQNISTLSPSLAKVIAFEFGYDANWVLDGDNGDK